MFCRYVTVGHEEQNRHLYYYFATSERNPTLDPVVIWINGGPACSGFSVFHHSIGKHMLFSDFVIYLQYIAIQVMKCTCSSLSLY
jgi:hypothetical protein